MHIVAMMPSIGIIPLPRVSGCCCIFFGPLAAFVFVASPSVQEYYTCMHIAMMSSTGIIPLPRVSECCHILFGPLAASVFVASLSVQELRSYHNKQTL